MFLARAAARARPAFSSTARRQASSLVLADHNNVDLAASTLSAVTAAKAVGADVTVLIAGAGCDDMAQAAAAIDGVTTVLVADDAAYSNGIAENVTEAVLACHSAAAYTHLFVGASNTGKNVAPRLGAALDSDPIMDILSVVSEDTFTRGMYAGNAVATVTSSASVKVISVRTTSFEKAGATGGSASVSSAPAPAAADAGKTAWVSDELSESDRPELTAASVVIAGGRGLKSGENFAMLETLADKLGGAVGASRAAVDAGFVPNDYQVGQTGKVVAPDLYVAAGISGAIQHLAGMKDSKCIVAINKDAEAPIFQVADYGLVTDLFDAVPELTEKL
eukprot:Stramenopile-MAST_4_protein_3670